MKKILTGMLIMLLLIACVGCEKNNTGTNKLEGIYKAVNPPVESGEMVIQELIFHDDTVKMVSGDIEQKVYYKIEDNKFTISTQFGDFEYEIEILEDCINLDGVTYSREK